MKKTNFQNKGFKAFNESKNIPINFGATSNLIGGLPKGKFRFVSVGIAKGINGGSDWGAVIIETENGQEVQASARVLTGVYTPFEQTENDSEISFNSLPREQIQTPFTKSGLDFIAFIDTNENTFFEIDEKNSIEYDAPQYREGKIVSLRKRVQPNFKPCV